MRLTRADTIRLDKNDQTYFTKEGYLIDHPIVTSTGVFEYHNDDGSSRYELRLPEEVFAPESLASYEGKPIIVTHDAGYVNKDNVEDESIGTILSKGYKDGDNVRAKVIIHDTDDMKKSGLRELSLGYNLDLDETPGEYNGQKYDAIQRNIRINHLALVSNARAGEQARLNIDSKDKDTTKGGKAMKRNVTRRDEGVMSPDELQKAIDAFQARKAERMAAKDAEPEDEAPVTEEVETAAVEEAVPAEPEAPEKTDDFVAPEEEQKEETVEDKIQMVKDRRDRRDAEEDPEDQKALHTIAEMDEDIQTLMDVIETMKAEKDMEKADCGVMKDGEDEVLEDKEAFEEKMNADSIDKIVNRKVDMILTARDLGANVSGKMTERQIKIATIKAVRPKMNLDGKDKSYINAAYTIALDDVKGRRNTDAQFAQMTARRADGTSKKMTGAMAARERMMNKNKGGKA